MGGGGYQVIVKKCYLKILNCKTIFVTYVWQPQNSSHNLVVHVIKFHTLCLHFKRA